MLIDECNEFGDTIPEALKGEYCLAFKMDVKSLLDFYSKIFTKAGLERITGINQNNYGIMRQVCVTHAQNKPLN